MDYETKPFTKPEQVTLPPQRRPNTQAMTPHIKMFVSDWYTDELGNKARIIKARDSLMQQAATPSVEQSSGNLVPRGVPTNCLQASRREMIAERQRMRTADERAKPARADRGRRAWKRMARNT
jgi:hypothetical protein